MIKRKYGHVDNIKINVRLGKKTGKLKLPYKFIIMF